MTNSAALIESQMQALISAGLGPSIDRVVIFATDALVAANMSVRSNAKCVVRVKWDLAERRVSYPPRPSVRDGSSTEITTEQHERCRRTCPKSMADCYPLIESLSAVAA
jgi:hypothetical protein